MAKRKSSTSDDKPKDRHVKKPMVRIDPELYKLLQELAKDNDRTATKEVERAVKRHLGRNQGGSDG